MPHSDHHKAEDHEPTQSDYLSGPRILPHPVQPDMTVADLMDQQFQAYNSARLHEASRLFVEKMLAPES
jgi:deoxyhypusine synthase